MSLVRRRHALGLTMPAANQGAGKIEDLVGEIVVLPPVPPEPEASRTMPEIERDSCINTAARMRSPTFRAQGMPVGSGIAEAAWRTVVSTRAKRAGLRWTPAGLDAVFALRTKVLNETDDAFCFPTPGRNCGVLSGWLS
ncbi:MAG TPA: hypothetical protein VGF67_28930 [Ktedonobacteraceae bacterium]